MEDIIEFRVSWIDRRETVLEAKVITFKALEDAADYIYKMEAEHKKLITKESSFLERTKTFFEIEKIVTSKIFIKEVSISFEDKV